MWPVSAFWLVAGAKFIYSISIEIFNIFENRIANMIENIIANKTENRIAIIETK